MKEIPNYDGRYTVDENGDVYATGIGNGNNCKPRKLKAYKAGKDRKYLQVRLYNGTSYKDFAVHRLVATLFITNTDNLPHVNHIDEDTFNNRKDNLEWCTPQYNKEYSSSKNYKFRSPDGDVVEVFNLSKFCKENNLSNGGMYFLMSGKYSQHKGWRLP